MATDRKNFTINTWSFLGQWCAAVALLGMGILITGCVAQQADVVRIKRELDAKISQLDKSKTSLQRAVTDANVALEKANVLIARQRMEIQELLHTRAEVMDQMTTLKDTDLSQVRGAIEKNQHLVEELDQKYGLLQSKVETVEASVKQSSEALDPLVQDFRAQLKAEEQLRTEQGGKLGEFRTSLVDYQQVLTALRQNVTQQEQQLAALQQHVEGLGQRQNSQYQQVQTDVKDVRQHIQSVIGTLEQISTTFSGRLDSYEKHRSEIAQKTHMAGELAIQGSLVSPIPDQSSKVHQPVIPTSSRSTSHSGQEVAPSSLRNSNNGALGAAMVSASSASSTVTSTSLPSSVSPLEEYTQKERIAYQNAFNLLRAKNYEKAAREFSVFLRTFPNSHLADNSQYWLGECYYGQRRFREAIDEFERVFALYSTSSKVPASLLKIGYSHLELQQPSMARAVFQQLVRTYPQSSEAIKAHGRLQDVNSRYQNPS
jgi:tol-pal system protein YbgF